MENRRLGLKMNSNDREDIIELQKLDAFLDVSNVQYIDLMQAVIEFISSVLLSNVVLTKLSINDQIASLSVRAIDLAKKFWEQKISVEDLRKNRILIWEEYDALSNGSNEKNLLRVVVCGLYDLETSEFETYGSDAIFEAFFATLLDLGSGYCNLFGSFLKARLPLNPG
jgi:hypothetical protein